MEDSENAPTVSDLESGPNPYAQVDVSGLPDWWRDAIDEFREYGLRPYRPPQFSDDILKHRVVERLERELGVEIDFVGVGVTHGDDWTVRIDGEQIGTIGRRRAPEGYTEFEMTSDEFAEFVRDRIE